MTSLILVLAVIALSLLVTRVAGIMLALTGMSRESARFQANSAFTGVGFTTGEAESVTRHPIRRRIVVSLMFLGSAGVVTVAASLIVSFGGTSGGDERLSHALVLLGGIVFLGLLSRSRLVDAALARATGRMMRASGLDVRDYAGLLQLEGGYRVGELEVEEDDWVAGRSLGELRLRDEGVIVLGIHRPDSDYAGVPGKHTTIEAGDMLVLYGREDRLEELDERRHGSAGDRAHREAVSVG